MTRESLVLGILILFSIKGVIFVTIVLPSWKERIFFLLAIFIAALVFATGFVRC